VKLQDNSFLKHEVIADMAEEEVQILQKEKIKYQKELDNIKARELLALHEREKLKIELQVGLKWNKIIGNGESKTTRGRTNAKRS